MKRCTEFTLLIICLQQVSPVLSSPFSRNRWFHGHRHSPTKNKLLLLPIDGVRFDYIQRAGLKTFEKLLKRGVRADFLSPVYPSDTIPNFSAIFSGLYTESHGLIDNFAFDPAQNQVFTLGRQPSDFDEIWRTGADIWTVARNQGVKSIFYQAGCEPFTTEIPAFCIPNVTEDTLIENFRARSYDALTVLEDDKYDIAAVYYLNIDELGHAFGPNSDQVNQAMKELDDAIGDLLLEIERRDLSDNINVLVFSDHGMIETDPAKVIDIRQYITRYQILLDLNHGATTSLWVAPENITAVFNQLKGAHPHLNVYLKEQIPERFHLRNNPRTPPIWLRADLGWYIITFTVDTVFPGWHGYDNDHSEMRGIFTAVGPDFRQNYQAPGIPNVDLYQLFAHLVDIEPAPHNGTWDHVSCMLEEKKKERHNCWFWACW